MFWQGLYIRNDNYWKPVCIWDKVKIITEWYYIDHWDWFELPETEIIWKLCLSKTKWIYILIETMFEKFENDEVKKQKEFYTRENRQFLNLKITNKTKRKQDWFLMFSKKHNKSIS